MLAIRNKASTTVKEASPPIQNPKHSQDYQQTIEVECMAFLEKHEIRERLEAAQRAALQR